MAPTALTDDDVTAAARGEPAALRHVYEVLSPVVLGYVRAHGCADPEATTGDVFVALLPRLRTVTGGAAGLRTLAFSIAHARVVDEARRRARRPLSVAYDPLDDPRAVDSAETEAYDRLATAGVLEVLAELPPDQRDVLTLRVVADLSVEQVARIIGRSPGAVKQLQRRALITVRRILESRRVTR